MDLHEKKAKSNLEDFGFTVNCFSKEEKRSGKTPDFRVFRNSDFVFYCEVKSITEDRWLDGQLDNTVCGELAGGARKDPIFNRLTSDIHEAVKQFHAVNQEHSYPNVLVFVNHDDICGFHDLLSVVTGNFYSDDGQAFPIYRQFSHGRIKDEINTIHLFVWLDYCESNQRLFNQTGSNNCSKIIDLFGIQADMIKQV